MKKTTTLLAVFLLCFQQLVLSQAIDTLLLENFENDPETYIQPTFANGDDQTWVNYDQDGYNDASGASRPGEWFWTYGFAVFDITGKTVKTTYSGVLIKGNQQVVLDVSGIAAGNYDVVVQHNNGRITGKVVVQ
ncbi:MAG: T9SS type A sorting domain-containing protein [Chitinophagales bacterium]